MLMDPSDMLADYASSRVVVYTFFTLYTLIQDFNLFFILLEIRGANAPRFLDEVDLLWFQVFLLLLSSESFIDLCIIYFNTKFATLIPNWFPNTVLANIRQ